MSAPRIALLSPNRHAWSETFIQAHIDHLPGVVSVSIDGALPRRHQDGTPLLSSGIWDRGLRRLQGLRPGQALERAIQREWKDKKVDVVLAEYGTCGEAVLDVCAKAGIPLVVHFHGIDAFHADLLREHANYRRIIAGARAIVVVSREMEQQLLLLGCPREKLHYNCYGIDVERFTPAAPERAGKQFLAVGRFVDKKAPHLTLLAFHKAWQQDPEMRLVFAGHGPLHDSTVQLAGALRMVDAVEFPGVLSHAQVAERMGQARAFVQHSIASLKNDHEGTPLSILEAMARALPVISTRHGGIPDVVEHGTHGLLGPEGDIETMATHLVELAADPSRAAAMGRAGRARVEQEHTLARSITALHAVLREAAR
jgi:colanic acid/amylovoran biosynthesis glycosyltransferase